MLSALITKDELKDANNYVYRGYLTMHVYAEWIFDDGLIEGTLCWNPKNDGWEYLFDDKTITAGCHDMDISEYGITWRCWREDPGIAERKRTAFQSFYSENTNIIPASELFNSIYFFQRQHSDCPARPVWFMDDRMIEPQKGELLKDTEDLMVTIKTGTVVHYYHLNNYHTSWQCWNLRPNASEEISWRPKVIDLTK